MSFIERCLLSRVSFIRGSTVSKGEFVCEGRLEVYVTFWSEMGQVIVETVSYLDNDNWHAGCDSCTRLRMD